MTTLTIDIRHAEPDDAPGIAAVHHAAWQTAYQGLLPHKTLVSMIQRRGEAWWARAIRGSASILVLDVGGVLAGYATLGLNRARSLAAEGEIYELYLLPEYQGTGLGRRLFNEARGLLLALGCKGMAIWCLEENDGGMAFYRSLGGRDVAEGTETFEGRSYRKVAFLWS